MIELYYWPTPNGHKITLFLEEAGLPYTLKTVDISKGEQFAEDFLKISPNNRIPALVDREPDGLSEPLALFESGAILFYLAEKTGQFLPTALQHRLQVLQWLFWQVGGLGPMAGQNLHFNKFATESVPYAQRRYLDETRRLYGVLENQLARYRYVGGRDYSIADMAVYPWVVLHEWSGQALADFPHLQAWCERINERPATQRAYNKAHNEKAEAQ